MTMPGTTHGPTVADDCIIEDRRLDRAALAKLAERGVPHRLVGCVLEEVDASRLAFDGWVFETCTVRGANFTGASLESSSWIRCRGGQVDFRACDLSESRIEGCDFNNGSFHGASLTGALIARCKLTGANLLEAKTLNLTFDETILAQARLPGLSFRKARLNGLDFQMADLRKSDFRDAVFHNCSLRDANLVDCRFDGADLRGADLGGIRLLDARQFKGATISRDQAGQMLAELGLIVR